MSSLVVTVAVESLDVRCRLSRRICAPSHSSHPQLPLQIQLPTLPFQIVQIVERDDEKTECGEFW